MGLLKLNKGEQSEGYGNRTQIGYGSSLHSPKIVVLKFHAVLVKPRYRWDSEPSLTGSFGQQDRVDKL